jgi:hypothetical protein
MTGHVKNNADVARKIQFILYTDEDLSADNELVTFRLSIQRLPNLVLWDSVLAPMPLKDIPSLAHKLVIERAVPGNDPSLLRVGFIYSIENTGNSSHMEYIQAGENFKIVDFNFH